MAGIGLYGVYYSKGVFSDGVLTGYSGSKMIGKARSATFTPNAHDDNPLYANNGIAERDAAYGFGGELKIETDEVAASAMADLFGLTQSTSGTGTGFDFTGEEVAAPVGVGFVRWAQQNNSRAHYQAVIFSHVTFNPPTDAYSTMEENINWQTPTLTGIVSGGAVCGAKPWKRMFEFDTQDAAISFIESYFTAST